MEACPRSFPCSGAVLRQPLVDLSRRVNTTKHRSSSCCGRVPAIRTRLSCCHPLPPQAPSLGPRAAAPRRSRLDGHRRRRPGSAHQRHQADQGLRAARRRCLSRLPAPGADQPLPRRSPENQRATRAWPLDSAWASSGPSPLGIAIGREGVARYEAALEKLQPEDQRAIVARCEWGMSHEEVAQAIGKPSANAARVAIHRALVRLAKEMAGGQ